ncbi:large conductance mechanosensitive channel protein MscL [Ornithinicoccus hortensis]|uniref:Large-conductance mechanosensitive channel n=1 Tax=Ornithinicoccus hortensis TaxID=82346 RepID=A0A542YVP9_9MICO|nr:large conductance mechanosensitive channel protein MscL [Ornithinicoccus hortensis]TQL52151.1 large conductance mechanosensitive channel [Ornithinicoccus hortensis]
MIQGFKDFIMRGNIVDLAVAVVIGTAFAAVVDAVVSNLINPLLARVGGGGVGEGLGIQLGDAGNPATFINLGAMINALIVFLLTAAVVYFVIVVPMNKINDRRKRGVEEPEEEVSEEVAALREIRDLLANRG